MNDTIIDIRPIIQAQEDLGLPDIFIPRFFGINRTGLHQVKKGTYKISMRTLKTICDVLGIKLSELEDTEVLYRTCLTSFYKEKSMQMQKEAEKFEAIYLHNLYK